MPLFGGMRRGLPAGAASFMPTPKPTEVLPKPNAQRRGLFGRIGQVLTPDRLQGLGAALIDAGTGSNTFNDVVAEQRQRPWLEEEMQGRRMDRKREQRGFEVTEQQRLQRQQAIESYIAGLDPDAQVQARVASQLDPEGFAERILGGGWEGGAGFTNAYRINPDGTVATGGALPLRPRAPLVQFGGIGDDGYDYEDGQ